MADVDKTVFISYRRSVGSFVARAVFMDLHTHGYDVFMDVESINSGMFDTIILKQIAARAHFLVILTPGSVERCNDPNDWLRREIEEALRLKRNIVPILANGFRFEDAQNCLTGELAELPRYNGLRLYHEYFDAAMEALRNRYLRQPTPDVVLATPPQEQAAVRERIAKAVEESTPTLKPTLMVVDIPEPETVAVPAGEFLMGTSDKDIAWLVKHTDWAQEWRNKGYFRDEQPQHRVYLSAYRIGRYPVTNREYTAFVRESGRTAPAYWKGPTPPEELGEYPVVEVSCEDATTYCTWLSGRTSRTYRLPTEAEWERAARGTDGRIYPWGNAFDKARCNTWESDLGRITPVGQYSPVGDSPCGCADMAGNVAEWCRDWYTAEYYNSSPRENPPGPEKHLMLHVMRGGSWGGFQWSARSAYRGKDGPDYRNLDVGFRVVVAAPTFPGR